MKIYALFRKMKMHEMHSCGNTACWRKNLRDNEARLVSCFHSSIWYKGLPSSGSPLAVISESFKVGNARRFIFQSRRSNPDRIRNHRHFLRTLCRLPNPVEHLRSAFPQFPCLWAAGWADGPGAWIRRR